MSERIDSSENRWGLYPGVFAIFPLAVGLATFPPAIRSSSTWLALLAVLGFALAVDVFLFTAAQTH